MFQTLRNYYALCQMTQEMIGILESAYLEGQLPLWLRRRGNQPPRSANKPLRAVFAWLQCWPALWHRLQLFNLSIQSVNSPVQVQPFNMLTIPGSRTNTTSGMEFPMGFPLQRNPREQFSALNKRPSQVLRNPSDGLQHLLRPKQRCTGQG